MNLLAFFIGASFGSFANVCIYRLPRRISVVAPRSYCPHCRRRLEWYELFPLFSFVLLKGRCGTCRGRISFQYPLVELASGAMALFLAVRIGYNTSALVSEFLFVLLLIIALIDWKNLIIPNVLLITGLIAGVLFTFLKSPDALLTAVLSGLFAGALMLLVRAVANAAFKKDTMGFGDITLAMLLAFFIGIRSFLIALWVASLIGCLYWLMLRLFGRVSADSRLPLGTFLSLSSFLIYILPIANNPFSR